MKFAIIATLAVVASAQDHPVRQAAALQGTLAQFHNAVSRTYATARLGALICKYDPVIGSGILRGAVDDLNSIPADAFKETSTLLPTPSFSALARIVLTAAAKCDSSLGIRVASDRVRARILEERNSVDTLIAEAKGVITDKPDRAAQLLLAAISAAEPGFIDFERFVRCISELRDRAPELGDDVFSGGIEFASKRTIPIPSYLGELGKYLFTSERLLERPDRDQESTEYSIDTAAIADFAEPRRSTNPETVLSYLQAVKELTENQPAWMNDAAQSYSLAYQMVSMARRYAPDSVDPLQQASVQIATLAGSIAAQVQARIGPRSSSINDEDLDGPRRRDRMIRRFQDAWYGGNLDRARSLLTNVDDIVVRGQLTQLVRWKETLHALERRDVALAMSLANAFPAGVKRALLYGSIGTQDALMLAWRDLEAQTPERREYALLVLAERMFALGLDAGYTVLTQAVAAHNEALVRPRTQRFDPAALRKNFSAGKDASFEAALLVRYAKPLYELVDSGRGRFSFQLNAPGVMAAPWDALLLRLNDADTNRLESIVMQLRDEAQLGPALVSLVQRRLEPGRGGIRN